MSAVLECGVAVQEQPQVVEPPVVPPVIQEPVEPPPPRRLAGNSKQHIAVYLRVSGDGQSTDSQKPDLETWLAAYANGREVRWYEDTFTGKTMDRPGWKKLQSEMAAGRVSLLLVWKLDRLGRKTGELCRLWDYLCEHRIEFRSLKDDFNLNTPMGRAVAGILSVIAQYESESIGVRVRAGQQAARAKGTYRPESRKGIPTKCSPEKLAVIKRLYGEGWKAARIAQAVGLHRATVIRNLRLAKIISEPLPESVKLCRGTPEERSAAARAMRARRLA